MRQFFVGTLLAIASLLLVGAPVKAAIFDTVYAWNSSDSIAPFGNPDTQTYGQTFVAPTDTSLDDFTFYINAGTGVHLQMHAEVYAWTGGLLATSSPPQGAIGPALFSAPVALDGNGAFQAVTAVTGGTSLIAGNNYVALFTVSQPADLALTNGTSSWGFVYSHVAGNGGGGFNWENNGSSGAAVNNGSWNPAGFGSYFDYGDAAWTAHFSPEGAAVPEPATLTIWALGALGCAFAARRRKVA